MRPLALALILALAGCFGSFDPPEVPMSALSEHAWEEASRDGPRDADGVSVATISYRDTDGRFASRLDLAGIKLLVAPSHEEALRRLDAAVRELTREAGVVLEAETGSGSRRTAEGVPTSYRTWDARATRAGSFTGTDAELRVLAEAFICKGNVVVTVVGQSQVAQVRTVGGQPVTRTSDPSGWEEIVADPPGTVEGISGSGLAHRIECG